MPLTSPLQQFAKLGVKVFYDVGATYDAGQRDGRPAVRGGLRRGRVPQCDGVHASALDLGWREGRGTPNAHVQLGVRRLQSTG